MSAGLLRGPRSGASYNTSPSARCTSVSFCHSLFSLTPCSSVPLTLKQTGTAAVNQYIPRGVEGGWGAAGRRKQSPLV